MKEKEVKNSIILIIPYFGDFNNYFDLWMNSAKKNKQIDFMIVTDNKVRTGLASNIIWKEANFEEIKKKIQELVPEIKIRLNEPYKLCEYKPFYGKLFEEQIKGYKFWGFCDVDLIFGALDHFITEDVLENFDKCYCRGHLTIYRNDEFFRELYKTKDKRLNVTYRTAWRTDYCCHFDETLVWNAIIKEKGRKCYEKVDFADIDFRVKRFRIGFGRNKNDAKQIYAIEEGGLYRYYIEKDKVNKDEMAYIHLQKRPMKVLITDMNKYLIVPNAFIPYRKVTSELILRFSPEERVWKYYYKRRIKEIASNIKNGAFKIRIIVMFRRFIYGKNSNFNG